jgi:polysaccharide deacetylase family protein (PEP-CTERM system associated)
MTVDVEDYFQVSAFDHRISRTDWFSFPPRISQNVDRILEVFDAHGVKGTFFTLGWIAEQHPSVIRRIVDSGHELASHGYEHTRISALSIDSFRQDVVRTKKMLEDVSGTAVVGYRAPSFSLGADTLWAHDVLEEAEYVYSSSIFPIVHDHYGMPAAPRFPFAVRAGSTDFMEVPLSTISFAGRNWPCAGGGYFRLLPFSYFRWAIRRINRREQMPCVFYFHPWELDPDQPRIDQIPYKSRFRHYLNLHRFESRLTRLLSLSRWGRMDEVFLRASEPAEVDSDQ